MSCRVASSFVEVERLIAGFVRHADAAAEIDRAHRREPLRDLGEFHGNGAPVVRVEDAAAAVRVQADDPRAGVPDQPFEFVDFETRDAELRMHAGGLDVLVVSAAMTRIDADEQLDALEQFRPGLQRIQVVQRDEQSPCRSPTRIPGAARNSA